MAHIPAERCLSIVELLVEEAGEMQFGDIALRLGLPKSGVHRLLGALIQQGWVAQDKQTSAYRLTMRLSILGQRLLQCDGHSRYLPARARQSGRGDPRIRPPRSH